MTAAQLRVCTTCPGQFVFEFTICGTTHLAPQIIADDDLAEYLREGWTVTYHDHG